MTSVESWRKRCLKQQTELRRLLEDRSQFKLAIGLFLHQHALLHSTKLSPQESWSFEDEVLADLPEGQARRVLGGGSHSIAWLIWHIARCEDICLNLLAGGVEQVLLREGWLERIHSSVRDTGNAMDAAAVAAFSQAVDLDSLRGYRLAVGRSTQEFVRQLKPEDLQRKVEPGRIRRMLDEGAVVEAARGLADYWSKRDVAGLLLMPATRHNLIHLSEAWELKRKLAVPPAQQPGL